MEISASKNSAALTPQPGASESAAPEALGRTIGRGATWMVAASLGGKVLAFASQIVLGLLMTKSDYAVFGVALAISGFVAVFRDGGVRDVLVQRGKSEYANLIGPVFWLATWMNILAGLMTWAVAGGLWLLQRYRPEMLTASYKDAWLPWMLVIIGLAVPMQSPAAVLQSRLRLDLRFGELSRITVWSAVLRNVSLVVGAWWLRNPLAFVIPMVIISFYEATATYRVTRESPWRLPAKLHVWKELLRIGVWMMLQSAANILFDLASFGVIGLILPQEVVGVYVFAYTWITQTQTLMGYALMQVLFSALARLKDDVERLRTAVRRAQRVQMLLGAVASLGLAVIMKPLESMIWKGNWAECVSVVMILGVFFPFRVTFGLSTAVMMARGHFKALSIITLAEGVLIVASAGIAAFKYTIAGTDLTIGGTANSIAYGVGIALLVGRIAGTWLAMRELQISLLDIIKGMFPAWLVSLAAAWAALFVTDYIHASEYVHGAIAHTLEQAPKFASMGGRFADGIMIMIIGGTFCLVMGVMSRLLLKSSVQDVLEVLPVRISRIGRKIMLMPGGN